MVLADLGAEVVRIARPGTGLVVPDPDQPDLGASQRNPWDVVNRNRPAIGVDLSVPSGVHLVRRLVDGADVLIEGFRPGVAERFGLGPDDLMASRPELIYARMTGWGRTGPMADRAGHDLGYLALSGVLAHLGRVDQPPTPPLNLVADFGGGGMLLAVGVLAALVERGTSGQGQVVDAAMVDGAALLMGSLFGAWSSGYWSAERGTNLLDSGAPFYDCYRCADDRWISVGAIESRFFAALVDTLGIDPTYVADQHDRTRWPELRTVLGDAFASRPRDEWAVVFADVDACVVPVLDMGEAPLHPHAVARGSFVEIDGVHQPAPAPRFSRTPSATPEPACGADDPVAVLSGWGVGADEVTALIRAGVIG